MPDITWYMDGDQPTPIAALPIVQEHFTEPYPDSLWRYEGGDTPINGLMAPILQERFTKPYPASLWRIDENNGGLPYNDLMLDVLYHEPEPPIPTYAVKQKPYITLYRCDTPQDGFDTHGMWVLTPTKCTITEVLNGKYELSMEHPIDPEGRWEYIRENNIIKALGQLFTIRIVNQQWKGNSGKVTCKADHIFYQLADSIIMRGESGITGTRVAEVCRQAVAKIRDEDEGRPPLFHYHFSGSSNMTLTQDYIMANVDFLEKEKTMVDFIMGSGGVLEGSEGKLHRDNFYYSIYKDVEGSQKNAFEIRVGKNLTGIKRTIDITTQATHYSVYNQFGWGMSLWLDTETMQKYGIPHHTVRIKETSFTTNRILSQRGLENYAAIMCREMCNREFKELCAPLVSYDVDVFEVKNNPDYTELVDPGGYKVGNSGTIVDPHVGTLTMEITQTITDALTGEVVNVLFGNRRDFVGKPAQGVIVDVDTEETTFFQVRDSEGFFCIDSEGALIIEYEGV